MYKNKNKTSLEKIQFLNLVDVHYVYHVQDARPRSSSSRPFVRRTLFTRSLSPFGSHFETFKYLNTPRRPRDALKNIYTVRIRLLYFKTRDTRLVFERYVNRTTVSPPSRRVFSIVSKMVR